MSQMGEQRYVVGVIYALRCSLLIVNSDEPERRRAKTWTTKTRST